jgi:F0F1-type ATP synthase delta subunit
VDVSSDMLNSSNTNNLNQIVMDASVVEDNKNLNNLLFSPTVGKTNQGKLLNDILTKKMS